MGKVLTKSEKEGKKKELECIRHLKSKGCRCKKSPNNYDMYGHWDYGFVDDNNYFDTLKDPIVETKSGDKYYRIDIKSKKRNQRHDAEYTNDFHWVEMKNVRGNKGWVHGDADYIVFETYDSWLFVDRQKLADFVEEKCSNKPIFTQVPNYYYEKYTRKKWNKKDIITKVPMKDLYEMSDFNLMKI